MQDDLCGADPDLHSENGYMGGTGVFQGGSTEDLESSTAVGMVIETRGRTTNSAKFVQKPITRHEIKTSISLLQNLVTTYLVVLLSLWLSFLLAG